MAGPVWRPVPFQSFVLKVHSRCNLACDYCYVYEKADQLWRGRPTVMDRQTLRQAARRIGEHVADHGLDSVRVIYHGGEPLLAGADFLDEASETIRRALPEGTRLGLSIQTNGVLLNERLLTVLRRHAIGVGISVDGDRRAHDRHRRFANGRGSYDRILESAALLRQPEHRGLLTMVICTIDVANDPVATYEALLELGAPALDFLMPLGNWTDPPPHRGADASTTPYGDWLAAVFDRWYGAPAQETRIRVLQSLVDEILGRASGYDVFGLVPVPLVQVETDGTIQQVCTLKSTFEGATATGFTVFDHGFDPVMRHPLVVASLAGMAGLAAECQSCPAGTICGGGYYPQRYRAGSGFRNRSVYCPDLYRLVSHVKRRVDADVAQLVASRSRGARVPVSA